jgi:hypothetical protein
LTTTKLPVTATASAGMTVTLLTLKPATFQVRGTFVWNTPLRPIW